MRKYLSSFLLIFALILTGCEFTSRTFSITEAKVINLNIGEKTNLTYNYDLDETLWYNSNPEVVSQEGLTLVALSRGFAIIRAEYQEKIREYFIYVSDEIQAIIVEGKRTLPVGSEISLKVTVSPISLPQDVSYSSSDETVATISDDGVVKALAEGLTTITIKSLFDPSYEEKIPLLVYLDYDLPDESYIITKILEQTSIVNGLDLMGLLEPLITTSQESVVGVINYLYTSAGLVSQYSASGLIYRRDIVLKSGEVIKDYNELSDYNNIEEFDYYVVTNRHVVIDYEELVIYYGIDSPEIEAELLAYDPKVDLAVMKFSSKLYFPLAKFGDSSTIETGEFIYTIGNPKNEYFKSASLGIISYPERYVSDDTDGDGVGDWHSEYIQHDAAINPGNSGGGVYNLKGEVIGVNTTKIVDQKVDNMGFAVPINLVKTLLPLLEEGIQPQRAVLGISVLDVKTIISSPGAFPEITIPAAIKTGLYVSVIEAGGLGESAGLKPGDIILTFDDIAITQTYLFRIILVKHSLGSGDVVPLEIYRNGQYLTLYVTF